MAEKVDMSLKNFYIIFKNLKVKREKNYQRKENGLNG